MAFSCSVANKRQLEAHARSERSRRNAKRLGIGGDATPSPAKSREAAIP
jgi:hypothetical protein